MNGISIIIPVFSNNQLNRLLRSFFSTNTHSPVEFIIIDHNSVNTENVAAEYATKCFFRIIKLSLNTSCSYFDLFSSSCNLGAKKAKYPYLFFANSHLEFTFDALPTVLSIIEAPNTEAVGVNSGHIIFGSDQRYFPSETAGVICRKNVFSSWENISKKHENGFDYYIDLDKQEYQDLKKIYRLNVLFVSHASLESNSGYHVQYYADRIEREGGVSCLIAAPSIGENEQPKNERVDINGYKAIEESGPDFPDGRGPDIVHAWTPREHVRKFCQNLAERFSFRTVIHMEDNEEYLTESAVDRPWAELVDMPVEELDELIPRNRFHPVRGRGFLNQADGFTFIIESLQRFNSNGRPSIILPAPVDERLFYPRPINYELRRQLEIPDEHTVLAYSGNVRRLKKQEALALYEAVAKLNDQGLPTTLIRTGKNYVSLSEDSTRYQEFEKALGWVERDRVPEILAAADILVQPGWPGPFDDQRVPAKLPEYFAIGRPVILPNTNIGLRVVHGEEGYVLDRADAESIYGAVQEVMADEKLRVKMSNAAVDFYLDKLSHSQKINEVLKFYEILKKVIH